MITDEQRKSLERQIIDAAMAGDKKKLERLRADLAFGELPDDLKRQYRAAQDLLRQAQLEMNRVIEKIPDVSRGKVIEKIDTEIKRLKSMGV
jgi:hypothetical protein